MALERLQAVFDRAVELDGDARDRYVRDETADDPALARDLAALLAADRRRPALLDGPALDVWRRHAPRDGEELVGLRVGDLEVVEVIGRGVGGVLVRAAPADGDEADVVVVEVLAHDVDGDLVTARFAEAGPRLRALDHPNLAPITGLAEAEDGRVCLVYSGAGGEPIDAFCDRERLSVLRRTELFVGVCEAVHHAHQRLVVHGALAPSTMLVAADGTVRVFGFGVAALLQGGAVGLVPAGPPARRRYASPEHVRGELLTTSCDVYALGVVLYELLTGASPYDGRDDVEAAILEHAPPPPSKAVQRRATTVGAGVDVSHRRRLLAGDLDIVVLRAVAKDPDRRYTSARNFGMDLDRWAKRRPVRARPDTFLYRGRKFLGRHRVAASILAVAGVVLLVGALFFYRRAETLSAAEADAWRAHSDAVFVSEYLADVLGEVAEGDLGNAAQVIDVLERAEAQLEEGDGETPEAEARLRGAIARVYAGLALWSDAERNVRRALELARTSDALGPAEEAQSLDLLGEVLYEKADPTAVDVRREALDVHRAVEGDAAIPTAMAAHRLAEALVAEENYEEAAPHAEHATRHLVAEQGIDAEAAQEAGNLYVRILKHLNRHQDAIRWQLRLAAGRRG